MIKCAFKQTSNATLESRRTGRTCRTCTEVMHLNPPPPSPPPPTHHHHLCCTTTLDCYIRTSKKATRPNIKETRTSLTASDTLEDTFQLQEKQMCAGRDKERLTNRLLLLEKVQGKKKKKRRRRKKKKKEEKT